MVELLRKAVKAVLGMLVLLAGSSRLHAVDFEPVWLRGGEEVPSSHAGREYAEPTCFICLLAPPLEVVVHGCSGGDRLCLPYCAQYWSNAQ